MVLWSCFWADFSSSSLGWANRARSAYDSATMLGTLDVGVGGIEGIDSDKGYKATIKTKASAVPPREGPRRGKSKAGVIGILLDSDLPQQLIIAYCTSEPYIYLPFQRVWPSSVRPSAFQPSASCLPKPFVSPPSQARESRTGTPCMTNCVPVSPFRTFSTHPHKRSPGSRCLQPAHSACN